MERVLNVCVNVCTKFGDVVCEVGDAVQEMKRGFEMCSRNEKL